ncbi:uncharacterized protein LOC100925754 isoform X4 [Sarcophilus harrisii]|uniref:uncharacterized protein LOC100925754 isoform X4 n=1 Tax=Sarcophilus harrisii TaxID=9305 RepID=UPI001301D67C|nr:uncharacterized protein LOC100925754 isoform X4 [Sarcophilus harrisii]
MSSSRKFAEYDKKKLQEENSRLKCELEVLRNQYDWLIEEGKSECFDERRINLLKAQVMQLQRQVVLLTEGLSSRAALLLELNEALNPLSQKLRSFLDWNSPTCEVPVARSELKQMIKMCHTLQSKLQKNYQTTGIEELALPWLMSRKNCTKPTVTLLDLCYGKMDNLNLQYVAKIQNASIPEFTVDSVLAILPTFPKGAPQEKAKKAVGALLKATNYSKLMTTQQINALQAEVNFHRSIYDLQIKYTKDVFDAIKHIYHSFLANIDGILCSPLKDVLSSYINLTLEPSDTAFKHFLYVLKNNAGPIQEAVDTLTPSENLQHEGEEALSKFGRELFLSLEQALRDCAEQRDKAARETEFLRIELEQAITELHLLKKERKEKGTESSLRFSKWKGEGGGVLGTEDPPTQFGSQKPRLVVNSIFSNKAENSRASSLQPQEETSEKAPLHHRGKNFRIKSIKPTRLSLQD